MKKNILIFITSYYPNVGGAEVAVKEITDRVTNFNYHLICFSDNKKIADVEKIGNVNVHRVNGFKFLFPFTGFLKALRLNKNIEFDAVWSIMATYAGFAGLFFKLYKKCKFLLTLQEGDPLYTMKLKAWFVYPLFVMIFRFADKIQAISNFLASYAKDMGYKKEPVVIPNGVDLTVFTKRNSDLDIEKCKKDLNILDDDFVLITASRLVYKNAVDDVIKSLVFLPKQVKFLVVGIGKEEKKLRKLAKDLGVRDRVVFVGFVPHHKITLLLNLSDVFIRVSRSEGFGNSFIEAMASGLPVISSPVGGIPDFISDGVTGLFACPNNPKSIVEKIKLLMDDSNLKETIGLNGQKMVVSDYSWDLVSSKIENDFFSEI
jgi:glycosyltransferase involved in cell wall biosynthesis